jgi:hypothetical protein
MLRPSYPRAKTGLGRRNPESAAMCFVLRLTREPMVSARYTTASCGLIPIATGDYQRHGSLERNRQRPRRNCL